jgi:hypothetical protein
MNREAIDVIFVPRVAGQKGLRPSASVSRLKKNVSDQIARVITFNRRPAQTFADSIFSLLDLSKENLHALRANR